jgi:hypothetical protein
MSGLRKTVQTSLFSSYAILEDRKSSGTGGGTFNSGDWRVRDLNTIVSDPDGIVSLSSNQVTLDSGTYFVRAYMPAYNTIRNNGRLYDTTSSSVLLNGTSAFTNSSNTCEVLLAGRIILSVTSVLEFQHRCQTNTATIGFGVESGSQFTVDHEVFTRVEIWKEN